MAARDYTKVPPAVWESVQHLGDANLALLYLYFWTMHVTPAGITRVPLAYVVADVSAVGWTEASIGTMRERLIEEGVIDFDPATGEVWVTGYLKHNQPMNDRHGVGLLKDIRKIASDRIRPLAANQLKHNRFFCAAMERERREQGHEQRRAAAGGRNSLDDLDL